MRIPTTGCIPIDPVCCASWLSRWETEFAPHWRKLGVGYFPRSEVVRPKGSRGAILALEIQINGHVLSPVKETP